MHAIRSAALALVLPLLGGCLLFPLDSATAEGYAAAEIGRDLGLSPATVESDRARAMRKLGVTTRPELVAFALRSGWLARG